MGNSSKGLEHLLVLKFVSGPNLLQVGGEQWKHQRMVANPAFHRNMPINLFGKLSQEVCSIIEKKCDEEVDVTNLMKLFTLESIGKAAFGTCTYTFKMKLSLTKYTITLRFQLWRTR